MSNEFDVVVIGGGPVGLWLACELALAKVKVLVLERRTERVTQSRGLTLHGRTLEVFALRGIAERFLSQGRPIAGFHFGGLDTLLDFSTLDSRFPFTLFLPLRFHKLEVASVQPVDPDVLALCLHRSAGAAAGSPEVDH
jgi:choline dehydrogenase-like flavoprotein